MRFISLFTGIGGLDLGLERAGWECVAQVEFDDYCNRVLGKHWPNVPRWKDIYDVDPEDLPDCDAVVGGFPCQPVSLAGNRLAQEDERWLWPEFFRIVRAIRPRVVVVENVPGLASAGMGDILGDLASIGYDAEWQSIPAAAVGAPHVRNRVFIVAYPCSERLRVEPFGESWRCESVVVDDDGKKRYVADAEVDTIGSGSQGRSDRFSPGCSDSGGETDQLERSGWWAVEPDVGRVAHGIPARVDRLRGLGNAVVPQVAEWIGRTINNADL